MKERRRPNFMKRVALGRCVLTLRALSWGYDVVYYVVYIVVAAGCQIYSAFFLPFIARPTTRPSNRCIHLLFPLLHVSALYRGRVAQSVGCVGVRESSADVQQMRQAEASVETNNQFGSPNHTTSLRGRFSEQRSQNDRQSLHP